MLKIIVALIIALVLAMGGKSYYKTKQANEAAAKVAQLEVEKKAVEDAKKREQQAEKDSAIAAAKQEIEKNLKDPASAQYRNLRVASGVCGEVNAKNSLGGYVGFRRFTYHKSDGVQFEPGQSENFPEAHDFFEYFVLMNCTPTDELEVICKAEPARCKVRSL